MPPAVTIMPFARDDLGAAPITIVDARLHVADCRPCRCAMRPSLMPMSALTMPQ